MEKDEDRVIAFDGFGCGYRRDQSVVSGVCGSVRRGELVALIGPNGAGKTTLLRSVLGQVPCTQGLLSVGGSYVRALSHRELARKVAFVPCASPLPVLTALQYVLLGRAPHRGLFALRDSEADLSVARAALDAVGAAPLAHRALTELSQGQQQMVRVARGLAQQAEALLLDEPAANLDPANHNALLALLARVAKAEGRAVVAAMHDVSAAFGWADSVWLVAGGAVSYVWRRGEEVSIAALAKAYGAEFSVGRDAKGRECIFSPLGGDTFVQECEK